MLENVQCSMYKYCMFTKYNEIGIHTKITVNVKMLMKMLFSYMVSC